LRLRDTEGEWVKLARFRVLASGTVLVSATLAFGQSGKTSGGDAFRQYYDWHRGKHIYEEYCQFCHGERGKGKGYPLLVPPPADLTDPAVQTKSDADLQKIIHGGAPGTSMGAWNWALSEQDKHDVLLYIRWLAR
jgi:cytochrome c553